MEASVGGAIRRMVRETGITTGCASLHASRFDGPQSDMQTEYGIADSLPFSFIRFQSVDGDRSIQIREFWKIRELRKTQKMVQ